MGVIWYKVWYDLWNNKVRTMLAILSIAVGVFAIGAIFGMIDQLLSTMDEAHQAIVPSHISLFLVQPIDNDTATRLENIEGVEGIEVNGSASIRYKLHPDDEWQPAVIYKRDYNHQIYDILHLNEGTWPERNDVGVERLSSEHFGIAIGDSIIFELDKTDRAIPVSGIIRHPFVEPPAFGGNAVFFMDSKGLERFNVPSDKYDDLHINVSPYSTDFSKDVASALKDRLAKMDIGVGFTLYQDPNEHWGRPMIEGFNFVLQILAVVSLFLSVILVTNTLTALITQQTNQIGIIKAIGGGQSIIIRLYLAVVLVYGVFAFLISLPLGAIVSFGMSQWFLNIFNIEYDVFQLSRQALAFQAVSSLIVPLLAALWPVLKGANITVREAMATYGLGADFGFSRIDQVVESIGRRFFSSPYAIALGNMFRRKGRLILTQIVLITAGTMFLLVMSLSSSILLTVNNDIDRRNFDIKLGFEANQRIDRTVAMATALNNVKQAEMWFTKPASLLLEGQRLRDAGVGAEVIGIPRDSTMFKPLIIEGRWLQKEDERAIVIAKNLADEHNIEIGDYVTLDLGELGDSTWRVVGFTINIVRDAISTDPVYAHLEALSAATRKHNRAARLLVESKVNDNESIAQLNADLKSIYEARQMSVNAFATATTEEDMENTMGQFGIVISMLLGLAIIVALVGGMGLMGSLSISVVERTREIGVMRAIGAKSHTIMRMFVMEGVLQGIMSWFITIPISFLITPPIARILGETIMEVPLDFKYNLNAVLAWLIIVTIVSTLASILPARSATRISVQNSLAYA